MKQLSYIIVLMAAFMLPSCSSDKEEKPSFNLFKTIPDDATSITAFDIDSITTELNYTTNNIENRLDLLLYIKKAIDPTQIIYFISSDKEFITFHITDLSILNKTMTDKGAKISYSNDYKIYRFDALSLAVKGEQGWMMDGGINTDIINKFLRELQ